MERGPDTYRRHLFAAYWMCALLMASAVHMHATEADGDPPDPGYRVTMPTGAGEVVSIAGVGDGIVVPPGYGQWGSVRLPVEPTIPPGTISLWVSYYGDPGRQALTLVYGEDAPDSHIPPYGLRLPPATDGAVHEAVFTVRSAKPINAVVLKRGDAGEADTLPVLGIGVGWAELQPDARVRAYRLLLQRPAPYGIVTDAPGAWLDEADAASLRLDGDSAGAALKRTEGWLAAQSHVAWVADQAAYVEHAARLLSWRGTDTRAVGHTLHAARAALNEGRIGEAEALLTRLETLTHELDGRLAGDEAGSVLPERQPVIVTWLKNWSLAGYAAEPTPLSLRWAGGLCCTIAADEPAPDRADTSETVRLSDAEGAPGFKVQRDWTGNVWRGPALTLRVSVLTPLVLIEDIRREVRLTFAGSQGVAVSAYGQVTGAPTTGLPDLASGHAAAIQAEGGIVLLIPTGAARLLADGSSVSVSCPSGEGIALLAIPPSAPVGEAVRFWSRVAASPPAECLQTYAGGRLTLGYAYRRRAHPDGIDGLRIAPVPPLLRLAERSGWRLTLPETTAAPALWRDPGFEYAAGDHLACDVPPMRGSGLCGINIEPVHATDAVYAELAGRGATSVRLALQDGRERLRPLDPAVVRELRRNLTACRRHGLRANVDLHGLGGSDKEGLSRPGEAEERAGIWREVARVCRRYGDALKAYDLTNEPQVEAPDQEVWLRVGQACIDAIREVDPDTPILVESAQMANPSGFPTFRPLRGTNLIYGVHYYYPHGFTHQRFNGAKEFGSPEASPFKFYPGWIPWINWKDEGWFNEPYEWWDRWELAGSALPVFEFLIRYRRPLDVGEFGVVGYTFDGAGPSATEWTSDVVALAGRWGASWDLWGYSTGFGWYGDVPDLLADVWQSARPTGRGATPVEGER